MESILSPEMRVKLTSDRLANSAIRKLYNHYDTFLINITNNFETPQRHVIHPRVSFRSESEHREFNELLQNIPYKVLNRCLDIGKPGAKKGN
jgi:hypothetical protein